MRMAKAVIRVFLIVLIIGSGYQALLGAIRFVGAFSFAATNPEGFGQRTGAFVGALIALILEIWAFRKLGAKRVQVSN